MAKPPKKGRATRAEILADIERQRLEKAAARREANRLAVTGAEVRVVEEREEQEVGPAKKAYVVRARRVDVFQHLLERQALAQDSFDAVRAYEHDVSVALGHTTPERRPDHIRSSHEGAPGQTIRQSQIEASRRVAWVESRLYRRDLELLCALLRPETGNHLQWRNTVQALRGERNERAQTAIVRDLVDTVAEIRSDRRAAA